MEGYSQDIGGLVSRWPGYTLQQKVYSTLNGDNDLADKVTGVFDTAPDEQPYPYITIGVGDIIDFSTNMSDGFAGFQQVDIWSQGMSNMTIKEIMERVYDLMNDIDMGLTDFPTVSFRCTLSNIITESDNRTKHGVMRFEFILGGKSNGR